MGLEVADASELAELRPIQTASVRGAMAPAAGADADDAADTGCVTPTASLTRVAAADDTAGCVTPTASVAGALAGASDDDGAPATDGTGSATPTASGPMAAPQPDGGADGASYATPTTCRTAAPQEGAAADDDAARFITPTSEDSALRPATVCPPAPRKLAPALKRKLAPLQQRLFYPVPRDLATVFMPPAAAKKMRAHAVEPSPPLDT